MRTKAETKRLARYKDNVNTIVEELREMVDKRREAVEARREKHDARPDAWRGLYSCALCAASQRGRTAPRFAQVRESDKGQEATEKLEAAESKLADLEQVADDLENAIQNLPTDLG